MRVNAAAYQHKLSEMEKDTASLAYTTSLAYEASLTYTASLFCTAGLAYTAKLYNRSMYILNAIRKYKQKLKDRVFER